MKKQEIINLAKNVLTEDARLNCYNPNLYTAKEVEEAKEKLAKMSAKKLKEIFVITVCDSNGSEWLEPFKETDFDFENVMDSIGQA